MGQRAEATGAEVTTATKKPDQERIRNGDFMRVKTGPLEGAEGNVVGVVEKKMKGRRKITLVEIRQLNGNPVRLPRHHFEFASMTPARRLE